MCIYLWCHIQTLSSHNHTEPFLSINFRYPVNDLVQCVEKKRWYEVRKKKKDMSNYCYTQATPWSLVVSPHFHTLIAVRVKYSGEDVKNHTNNGLLRLKIRKINIKIIEHHRALEHHVNMERFIGINIPLCERQVFL